METTSASVSNGIELLAKFGDHYHSAVESAGSVEIENELIELTLTLLAQLTGTAPTRDDVESVLPFDLEAA